MSYCLAANKIHVGSDDGVLIIGFADDAAAPSSYVTMQLAETFDAQDVALGMDKIHIELEDQIRSHYGGIVAFALSETRLTIELDGEAQHKLGVAGAIEISLAASGFSIDELKTALAEMAKGQGIELR